MQRFVFAVSGASGMPLAVTLLRAMATIPNVETHLVVSDAARQVLHHESSLDLPDLAAHAHTVHSCDDFAAGPASGSWRHSGMVECPCSMATLAAIAHGTGTNLIHRAAVVTLKERRPLVLVARETPLSRVHLANMLAATEAGATVMPPCPGFYGKPLSVQDVLDHLAGRVLDQLGLPHHLGHRWQGG